MPDRREPKYFPSPDPHRRERAARILAHAVDLMQGAADTLDGDGRDVNPLRSAAAEVQSFLERMSRWGV